MNQLLRNSLCAFVLGSALIHATQMQGADRPNIIVIMSDDMGISDLRCYGGEIKTPNLDALAEGGIRFTQFYNTARCCPTRASLLTGLYPHQAGVGHMVENKKLPGYQGHLANRCMSIAEVLRPAGYGTYAVGKWHVVRDGDSFGENQSNWPLQRGFDKFYGTITGAGSFYDPTRLARGNELITPENDSAYQPKQYYYTDAITENAIEFLKQNQSESASKPFFLYVAYTAAHWPMHALPEDIQKYRGVYDGGYQAIREARHRRMKELGIISPDVPLPPPAIDWAKVENKEWEIRCMEVYAAMVDRMDQGIGRLVDHLRKEGKLENTLVMFLQDNGGCAEGMGRNDNPKWHLEGVEPLGRDGLQRNIWPPMRTRDGHAVLGGPKVMPGGPDTYIAYGEGWANVSNTPLREYKHWVHEGGISSPLIVHWPLGMQRSVQGRLNATPTHLIDIAMTCMDVGEAKYPTVRGETPLVPLQGISLKPAFSGFRLERSKPIFWEHEGNRAVRDGRWKLVAKGPKGPWELYDIDQDRVEQKDLAKEHPERVREMADQWQAWAQGSYVLPWPWKE